MDQNTKRAGGPTNRRTHYNWIPESAKYRKSTPTTTEPDMSRINTDRHEYPVPHREMVRKHLSSAKRTLRYYLRPGSSP
ncbi:hypothetical protein EMCG_02247 [[Emmonsia] crescens]|uniref:Uncharacterized protein n=1 Tax=[Emmonsia] crescens TaxID=73230 RepID=A0A0G2J964_9EURO|nr:hypothetical protein EMCG_02247 [Emmonsia crescens UAMH 3008]